VSRPVVQPLPGGDSRALDAALGRLARDPRDIDALIAAGNAALAMGDLDAATGFYRRADQVAPGSPRVKAGLAGAMVRRGDPFDAIPLFQEAERAGALDTALAADRGLAYDLVGDNVTAQGFYHQALASSPNDEVVRRLALSYAIAGDRHNAELTLSPLLQQRDLAAWRTRVFALAILGQTDEAVSIANTILPASLASSIAPYLRYMPRLTPAQQAAAANFGSFPRASEIGRDDPRVAQYAPARRPGIAAAEATLTPQGEPLGRKRDRNRASRDREAARTAGATSSLPTTGSSRRGGRVAPPEPLPTRNGLQAAVPSPVPAPTPQVAMATPAPTPAPARPQPTTGPVQARPVVQPTPAPLPAPAPAPLPTPMAAARPAPAPAPISPGFALAPRPPAAPSATPPATAPASPAPMPATSPPAPARPAPTTTPALPRSLAEAFAEFERPSTDATPASGAVDIRRIARAKPKAPEAPKPPPPPSHPSRIWVQVATGRDKAALGFDWRRMTREAAEVFRGKQPYVTAWGQTNRLLTGPFQSEAAASSFIAQLRRADVDGAFVWTSPAGQVVDAMAAATPKPGPKR
jgi:Flp pilus assembly protein TadD